jgi:hypothetical protein
MERTESEHGGHRHTGTDVTVTFNGTAVTIPGGEYRLAALKAILGVPADYALDRVVDSKFLPLSDDKEIEVHEGEVFVSQPQRGGSSS